MFPLSARAESLAAGTASEEGNAVIHILALCDSDCIILESNGHFGIVDCGEDSDYPSGDDSRYPLRDGINTASGYEDFVISYLQSLGARPGNVEFLVGTHPHSDHIGCADEVIRAFLPKRVYTPEYDDSFIKDDCTRWDNQYVYDNLVQAATDCDLSLIQKLDPNAPVAPEEGSTTGCPSFMLGAMEIDLVTCGGAVSAENPVEDANSLCWSVLVKAFGKTAFLAADITNMEGAEDRLAPMLGTIDVLKLGHHGLEGAGTSAYITTLSPLVAVQTGSWDTLSQETYSALSSVGALTLSTSVLKDQGYESLDLELCEDGICSAQFPDSLTLSRETESDSSATQSTLANGISFTDFAQTAAFSYSSQTQTWITRASRAALYECTSLSSPQLLRSAEPELIAA